MYKSKVLNRGY